MRFHRLRQAEVEHFDRAVWSDLHIGWLQVAMDDPSLVRRFERVRDLFRNRHRLVERNRSLRDPVGERRPFHQLEDEGRDAVCLFEAVNAADVRMIQCRERLRFAPKARNPFRIGDEQIWQNLKRDLASELRVSRAIDLAMPPTPIWAVTS